MSLYRTSLDWDEAVRWIYPLYLILALTIQQSDAFRGILLTITSSGAREKQSSTQNQVKVLLLVWAVVLDAEMF